MPTTQTRPFMPCGSVELYGVVRPTKIGYFDSDGILRQINMSGDRSVMRGEEGTCYLKLTAEETECMTDRPIKPVTLSVFTGDDNEENW